MAVGPGQDADVIEGAGDAAACHRRSAFVGKPHSGRKPGAQADETAIIEHCRKHLGGFQVPKFIKLLDEMPMTATGKLRKVELRQQFSEHFAQG